MKRELFAVVCAGLAIVMAAAGCAKPKPTPTPAAPMTAPNTAIPGAAPETPAAGKTAPATSTTPPPPPPPQLVTPAKINSILLPLDEVSVIVGATLGYKKEITTPTAPVKVDGDKSVCAVLFGLDSNAFGQDADWQAFRNDRQQESEADFEHLVYQRAAIYPDTATPAKLLQEALQPAGGCNGAVVHNAANDANSTWQFQGPQVTGDRAQWINFELVDGKANGWRCAHDVRVKNNVLLEAQVCNFGDPGPLATTVADRMSSWIPA